MEELSALLLALYGAAREVPLAEFPDAALRLLQPMLAFTCATWASGRVLPDGVVHHSIHLLGEPPDRLMDYEEVKQQDTAAFAAWNNLGRALTFHVPSLYRDRTYSGIREYAKRWEHQNFILATRTIEGADDLVQWVGVYRADPDDQYTEQERQCVELLLPHLIEALNINRTLHLGGSGGAVCDGTAIIDRFGALHHANERFLELIRQEWPMSSGSQLRQFMIDLLRRCQGSRYAGRTIVVCIRRVSDLVLLNAREKAAVDGLTPRQFQVARHVADGLSYKQIARRMGLSPTTVRNYIQAIHERMEVRTNAELSARLNAVSPCRAER